MWQLLLEQMKKWWKANKLFKIKAFTQVWNQNINFKQATDWTVVLCLI